jgi:aspartate racemase
MKTIGILGGLGPQATMDFEKRVHRVSQQLISPRANSGYPPMVVWYCRFPPILLNADGTPQIPVAPEPRMLEAARKLGEVADFLVIPSNTPHMLTKEIEGVSGLKILSMIDITIDDIRRRHWQRIGVLGFHDPIVYTRPLAAAGMECLLATSEIAARIDASVLKVMEGRDDESCGKAVRDAIADLQSREVDGILLGCTELPLMLGEEDTARNLLNPAQLLAEAAVRFAME